jgi:hypothetical protein
MPTRLAYGHERALDVAGRLAHALLIRRVGRPAVEAGGPAERPRAVPADPDRHLLLRRARRERHSVDHVVAPVVIDPIARPEPAEHLQALVQLIRPRACVGVLAEGGELRGNPADPGAEHHAAAAEHVEGRDLVGKDVRPPPRNRRDVGAEQERAGPRRDGGERHPGIGCGAAPDEAEVIPDEERLPAGRLGLPAELDHRAGIGIGADVGDAEPVAHRRTLGSRPAEWRHADELRARL